MFHFLLYVRYGFLWLVLLSFFLLYLSWYAIHVFFHCIQPISYVSSMHTNYHSPCNNCSTSDVVKCISVGWRVGIHSLQNYKWSQDGLVLRDDVMGRLLVLKILITHLMVCVCLM